jgi:hypothetical protein
VGIARLQEVIGSFHFAIAFGVVEMKVAISQPTYLPWIGYFDLIDQVDVFVLLDNVQFKKRSWQQRNRIKTPIGLQWLTVPVVVGGRPNQQILEVKIREMDFWVNHCRAIELNYRRSNFFGDYFETLTEKLKGSESKLLFDMNLRLIDWFIDLLDIKTRIVRSSELHQAGKRTELLANICTALGATQYVSPLGSADYLLEEKDIISNRGIEVVFQNYVHPEYTQLFPPFLSYASALDLLFNEGRHSLEILRTGRRDPFLPLQVAAQLGEHAPIS